LHHSNRLNASILQDGLPKSNQNVAVSLSVQPRFFFFDRIRPKKMNNILKKADKNTTMVLTSNKDTAIMLLS